MKRRTRKTMTVTGMLMAAVAWVLWQFGPIPSIQAVASLSDPAKLATLGERGANSRLNKIVYWLHESESRGVGVEGTVGMAQWLNWTTGPRASLVRDSLLRNYKIAGELGLLTAENLGQLRQGRGAVVTRGPYTGDPVEIDHIVPYSLAPEAGNELANLEMMPRTLNRQKSDRVGDRQVEHARKLLDAGLISKESMARVVAQQQKRAAQPQ